MVVVRYFGGTKLGVGGLIRAYSEAAEAALLQAPLRQGVPAVRVRIRYPYDHTAAVMRALEQAEASGMEHGYSEADGAAEVVALIPVAALERLREVLREQTSGGVDPEPLEDAILYRPVPRDGSESA